MIAKRGITISGVIPNSIAAEMGVKAQDRLLSIQGQMPRDYIDYVYLTSDENLEILIAKPSGEEWLLKIEREPGEKLGIQLAGIIYDDLKKCSNQCIFCFVQQMPPGLRKTLYLKDDDYRFSFLQGSFITLTNLTDDDLLRIKSLKLSPLYISVHTTNPSLRSMMMGNKKIPPIMEILRELKAAEIDFHTQIVLCPKINDGQELEKSIIDLETLRPNLLSLAIVPVGLTKFRKQLYSLQTFSVKNAERVMQTVSKYQRKFAQSGQNFIYLADEFYLLTGEELPLTEEYHGFPQLENGIGLSRLLLDEVDCLVTQASYKLCSKTKLLLVTSVLGAKVINRIVDSLTKNDNLQIELLTVRNEYFGEKVTVAGLLTGRDLLQQISFKQPKNYAQVVIPRVVLNDEDLFIDGITKEEFLKAIPNALFVQNFQELFIELERKNLLEVKSKK